MDKSLDQLNKTIPQEFTNSMACSRAQVENCKEIIEYTIRCMLEAEKIPKIINQSKNTKESMKYIQYGNKHFSSSTWQSSLKNYTNAVIQAPANSNELATAFANRSAALYKGGLYEDCLLDINRALTIGYPDKLKAKIYARRVKCLLAINPQMSPQVDEAFIQAHKWLEKMEESEKKKLIFTLKKLKLNQSFKKPFAKGDYSKFVRVTPTDNPRILRASGAIELKYSDKFGRHITATRDIIAGETLLVQRAYAEILPIKTDVILNYCWQCSKRVWAGVPCHQCVNIIYCNEHCRDIGWREHHDFECTAISSMLLLGDIEPQHFMGLRITVKALKEAGTLNALKEKLGKIDVITDPIAQCFAGRNIIDDTKYATVYLLNWSTDEQALFIDAIYSVAILYFLAVSTKIFVNKINKFEDIIHNDEAIYLANLIARNIGISVRNGIGVILDNEYAPKGGVLLPFLCLWNHSCDPTVTLYSSGDNYNVVALQPIKKGQQLFMDYGDKYTCSTTATRRAEIQKNFYFFCDCIACTNNWSPDTRFPSCMTQVLSYEVKQQLRSMKDKYLKYTTINNAEISFEKISEVLIALTDMLNFYGKHVEYPCEELIRLKLSFYNLLIRIPR